MTRYRLGHGPLVPDGWCGMTWRVEPDPAECMECGEDCHPADALCQACIDAIDEGADDDAQRDAWRDDRA